MFSFSVEIYLAVTAAVVFLFQKRLPEIEAAAILKKLTETIAYLHENGVVHRDLKPANILFASEDRQPGSVTICDMGFAKQVSRTVFEFLLLSSYVIVCLLMIFVLFL